MSKFYHYRKPTVVRAKGGWYVKYYYRVPVEVRHLYLNSAGKPKIWERFRIKDDINKRKGADREAYAEWLRDQIEESLKMGYNPFSPEKELVELNTYEAPETSELDATSALNLFLEKWKDKGLEPLSYAKYVRYVNRLIDWL
ncbi:MAG TPA: hypothetical protein PLS87_09765, partial [Ferruginibacter sp.]|nr:hypothetical protein [Ferruginibacter sp.]